MNDYRVADCTAVSGRCLLECFVDSLLHRLVNIHSVVYGVAVVHACVKGLPATLFLSALRGACNDLRILLMVLSLRNTPPELVAPRACHSGV